MSSQTPNGYTYPDRTDVPDLNLWTKTLALDVDGNHASPWTPYSPTLGGVPILSRRAKHRRIRDHVEVEVHVVVSGAATGALSIDLPTWTEPLGGTLFPHGLATLKDVSAGQYYVGFVIDRAEPADTKLAAFEVMWFAATNSTLLAPGQLPFALASGDVFGARFAYVAESAL